MLDVMYTRYILIIASVIIMIMMDILYFFKPKMNKRLRHKVYSYLIIWNTFLLFSVIGIMVAFWIELPYKYCIIALKTRDILMMLHFTLMLFYNYVCMIKTEYNNFITFLKKEKTLHPHLIFTAIFIIANILLPYNVMTKETYSLAFSGLAFYLTILYCVLTTLEIIYIVIYRNKNKITYSDKISLIYLFSLMMFILIFQVIFSEVDVMGIVSFLYSIGLYFLFENPDLEIAEEIDVLTKDIERANLTKSMFLSIVSKEMMSPINSIVLYSDLALNEKKFDENIFRENAKQLELSSKKFLEIINSSLDISNVDINKEVLKEKNYSLTSFLSDFTEKVKRKMENDKVKLIINIDKTIPDGLYGDSNKLYQILYNVISSSIDNTKIGRINFSLNKEIKGNVVILKFSISDTSEGIKKEEYDKIFSSEYLLDEGISSESEADRLELNIAKKYVELFGGEISFESVPKAGTTFIINIPQQIVDKNSILGDISQINDSNTNKSFPDYSNYKVLLIDDDELNLGVIKRLLLKFKIQVETCNNGEDSIFKYKNGEHYDMIIVDHSMPVMDGVEVLHVIKSLQGYQVPPIIALTATTFSGSREMFLEEGFDDYLSKPIDLLEVEKIINKYFKK